MSDEPRLCKDCRHMSPNPRYRGGRPICSHPTSLFQPSQDLVTGEVPEPYQMACEDVRTFSSDTLCGRSGRYWEPRGFG